MDYNKIYSFWPGDTPRPGDLPHVVIVATDYDDPPGVPLGHTTWCSINCRHPWAWWFDEHNAYMGFSDIGECLLYRLSNQ